MCKSVWWKSKTLSSSLNMQSLHWAPQQEDMKFLAEPCWPSAIALGLALLHICVEIEENLW